MDFIQFSLMLCLGQPFVGVTNWYVFLYDLIFFLTSNFLGVIGFFLLIAAAIRTFNSKNTAVAERPVEENSAEEIVAEETAPATFGYSGYGWGVGIQMLYSTGYKILEWKNEDWTFPAKKDMANEALFDLRDLVYSSGSAILSSHGGGKTAFGEQRVAFIDGEVHDAMGFAGLDLNYGILPFPKYRKNVKEYYTIVDASTPLFGVMRNTTAENAECISIIAEASSLSA